MAGNPELGKLISVMYFMMTTLSTVGYGDMFPISELEMILGMIIMLCGTAFFGYLLGTFGEIIQNQDTDSAIDDMTFKLHNWTTMLRRFRHNNPLPYTLYHQINNHFKFYWKHDRTSELVEENKFHQRMPGGIKRGIIIHYLFDDVFYNFRNFFCQIPKGKSQYQSTPKDSKFLYEVAFGLKPRKFLCNDEENLIYEEEEEVAEMYFISVGQVAIGFTNYLSGSEMHRKNYKLTYMMQADQYFGDFYLTQNLKSEFLYIAHTNVEAFSLSKKFLMRRIFSKFPDTFKRIKNDAEEYY